MKKSNSALASLLFILFILFSIVKISGQDMVSFTEYKANVINKQSAAPLAFAGISVDGTDYSTVTNTNGEFSIKIPASLQLPVLSVQYIGFRTQRIAVSEIKSEKHIIALEPVVVELPELNVLPKDAEKLVTAMFENKAKNYPQELEHLTAFYRETIRKNKLYASLSEAVVSVDKQSYNSYRTDVVRVFKARKKTDYAKVDTLVFKLMGGPYNSLYLDLLKYPEMIFTDKMLDNYDFIFERSTRIDERLIYVVDFKQKPTTEEPLYAGKLYIDAQNLALKTAVFSLNLKNREAAARMFVVKKPYNADAYPTETSYRVDFVQKDKKWHFGYSRIEMGLRVNWKRKLFNSTFYSTIEMAVTERKIGEATTEMGNKELTNKDKIRPNIVIADEVSGFSDPDFWGAYNVIEPEKPIEAAIRKIQKQLQKK